MDNTNGVLFNNYYSAGPNTMISLSHTLALESGNGYPQLNNSIISLANKAGFKTYWLSNQGSIGIYDNSVAAIGKKAMYSKFLKKGSFVDGNESDDTLLPFIDLTLADKIDKKKLIVVHLMGSHPAFCDRTYGKYTQFYQSKDLSCYVQSINDTDSLLAMIVNAANARHTRWTMLYFSDHGLKMRNPATTNATLFHADDAQVDYHIPLFITAFDSNTRHLENNLYSARNFLAMFSLWTGIEDVKIKPACTPLSLPRCSLESVSATNFKLKQINVFDLPNDGT